MSLPTVWHHHFKFLSSFEKLSKWKHVRFVKKVGKLAKFVILSQDARETRHVLASAGKSNTAMSPGHIDSQKSPLASTCDGAHISQYCAWPDERAGPGETEMCLS